ncbi:hypothetical protein K438DRAFT_332192 [Mycena galopus ATCC 62051]|nr:hypothetical protein K438DRAFT_332192 [Mycena galopus ATCC 62051]
MPHCPPWALQAPHARIPPRRRPRARRPPPPSASRRRRRTQSTSRGGCLFLPWRSLSGSLPLPPHSPIIRTRRRRQRNRPHPHAPHRPPWSLQAPHARILLCSCPRARHPPPCTPPTVACVHHDLKVAFDLCAEVAPILTDAAWERCLRRVHAPPRARRAQPPHEPPGRLRKHAHRAHHGACHAIRRGSVYSRGVYYRGQEEKSQPHLQPRGSQIVRRRRRRLRPPPSRTGGTARSSPASRSWCPRACRVCTAAMECRSSLRAPHGAYFTCRLSTSGRTSSARVS